VQYRFITTIHPLQHEYSEIFVPFELITSIIDILHLMVKNDLVEWLDYSVNLYRCASVSIGVGGINHRTVLMDTKILKRGTCMVGINQRLLDRDQDAASTTTPNAVREAPAYEVERRQINRKELIERIRRAVPDDGVTQVLEDLFLAHASSPLGLNHAVLKPCFCVIAQGSKAFLLGDSRYRYDPDHYLIATLEMPLFSQILEATPQQPYLSLRMDLPPSFVESVIKDAGQGSLTSTAEVRAMDVSWLDISLQDAVVRLIRLLDTPAEVPVLMPLIKREIVYRLLMGRQGARLRHLAVQVQGSSAPYIARAAEWIQEDYDKPLHIEELARKLGMSVSGLHHRFKAVTSMSPLQFQKRLRLQEARRLMLSEDFDAASAAYRVGYNDPAYFNREYKSLFGVPPIRHVQRLREAVLVDAEG
jgi:AraC-like DNA-binding protein